MNILDKILEVKTEEVKILRQKYSFNSFKEFEFFEKKCFSFYNSAKANKDVSIIAEVKKASPSKGIIREDFDHLKIAEIYFEKGADAISVLTDKKFFQGDIKFLSDIASIKQKPILRKDFIIDEYQIIEAKAAGADLVLLICEALEKIQVKDLSQTAAELGMEVLLELHSENQLHKIDFNINKIIGVNNRNLEDFSTDLNNTINLSQKLPKEILLVAESGISKKEDVKFLKKLILAQCWWANI